MLDRSRRHVFRDAFVFGESFIHTQTQPGHSQILHCLRILNSQVKWCYTLVLPEAFVDSLIIKSIKKKGVPRIYGHSGKPVALIA